jgi:uncharacterized membrane protein YeaQ/YmgE (transglycosylase-associated protein family)
MVIIDLMTASLGVRMGFLAFLFIGGISGASALALFPGSCQKTLSKLIAAAFIGFLAAFVVSYLGQFTSVFQSGQMLEWFSTILAASLAGGIYAAFSL